MNKKVARPSLILSGLPLGLFLSSSPNFSDQQGFLGRLKHGQETSPRPGVTPVRPYGFQPLKLPEALLREA